MWNSKTTKLSPPALSTLILKITKSTFLAIAKDLQNKDDWQVFFFFQRSSGSMLKAIQMRVKALKSLQAICSSLDASSQADFVKFFPLVQKHVIAQVNLRGSLLLLIVGNLTFSYLIFALRCFVKLAKRSPFL